MEALIEVLLQLLLELGLQIGAELFCELGLRSAGTAFDFRPRRSWVAFLGYIFLGAVVGGLSLIWLPNLLIQKTSVQYLNLALTPILAGGLMSLIGMLRESRGQVRIRLDQFSFGFAFALAMAAVRFLFAG